MTEHMITAWTACGDDSEGTWAHVFSTEDEAYDCILGSVGKTRDEYLLWADGFAEADADDADIWGYISANKNDPHLDTYNVNSQRLTISLPARTEA